MKAGHLIESCWKFVILDENISDSDHSVSDEECDDKSDSYELAPLSPEVPEAKSGRGFCALYWWRNIVY